ncbi:hypothetical protein CEXT_194001 [Caerostris extrusa]|uniref:Uncharacterized protein n=1 Tax=Caerostris extrusa TaxID=172846 RepID=A0AAV4QB36_CAEEX|nr:hypothetical protein CEXT_194001 [Caerostris extrusa]
MADAFRSPLNGAFRVMHRETKTRTISNHLKLCRFIVSDISRKYKLLTQQVSFPIMNSVTDFSELSFDAEDFPHHFQYIAVSQRGTNMLWVRMLSHKNCFAPIRRNISFHLIYYLIQSKRYYILSVVVKQSVITMEFIIWSNLELNLNLVKCHGMAYMRL